MAPVPTNRVYEEYDPPSDLVTEDGCDTILLYLPGYRKEQLRVQLTTSRILKISGERQIGDNKWRRFSKEYPVPTNCETKEITARFEGGILYIRQPKTITPAPAAPEVQPADKAKTAAEAPRPSPQKQKVPEVSLPQPPQHAPALPQPQPQPRPQPQPQPQSQPRSQPQPQPQPQLQPEPQKDFEEEKTKRNGSEYDAARKEQEDEFTKDEGRNGHLVSKARLPQMNDGGRGGFFQELQKPDNLKRLVISVLLVLGIGFYATYMFKSFAGNETDRVSEL